MVGVGGELGLPGHHPSAVAQPPGMREGNKGYPRLPLLLMPGTGEPNAGSPLPPTQHLRCLEASWAQNPSGPVRCEHHGATRFDDIQNEVPEEAPCLGVHPCGWFILGDRQHPQTCEPWDRPCHSLPVLSPAQATIPHSRRCMAYGEAGGGVPPTWSNFSTLRAHQEDEGWVSNERNGCGQLPLVAPTVGAGRLVCVLGQLQLLQCPLDHLQGMGDCCHPAKATGLAEHAGVGLPGTSTAKETTSQVPIREAPRQPLAQP